MMWNNPTEKQIRDALEGWEWNTWRMVYVTVERQEDDEFGDHYRVTATFEYQNRDVGLFAARYCADGRVYLEHVKLNGEYVRMGTMTRLLADFQPHYREWGMETIVNPTPVKEGVAFAQSQGFEPLDGDPNYHVRAVEPE